MRVKKFKRLKRIEVTWVDIVDDPSWRTLDDMFNRSVVMVKQPGYFICNKHCKERGDMLIMATSISEDANGGYVVIPWGCIRKVEVNGKC